MEKLLSYLRENKESQLSQLKELLKIKSISAQPKHNADTKKAAEWLTHHLTEIGMENAKLIETNGHPVVYAEWLHAENKPIVLIYGHYDVQAPDPLEEWESAPFEPTIRKGNIYARGVADDKGQLFTHVKSIEALLNVNKKLPVNVKFLIEGEEEVGGPNLDNFIKENKDLLKADVCLISDSHALSETQPQLEYGLKGLVYAELTLTTMKKDAHSGLYGGNIPNPANELASLIAKLKDEETQMVMIEGFYDNVRKLSETEIKELQNAQMTEESIKIETKVAKIVGEAGYSVGARAGARPTLDVNGMCSGYTGEGPKTIIPAKAKAKISMRIVPHQTSSEISQKFVKHIKKLVPEYCRLNIEILSTGEPILMDRNSSFFKLAEKIMQQTFGNKPVYELLGGSIPVTATLKSVLSIDSILMGFGLPDDGLHSPNEKMSLEMFYKGIETSTRFLLELAK